VPLFPEPARGASKITLVPQTLPNPTAGSSASSFPPAGLGILDAPAALRLWHLTSLDAPTVAVVWSLAFAWSLEVRLPGWIPALLALASWAVYVCDRLLDARAALRSADLRNLRERHYFHHRHRRLLAPLAVASTTGAACIVFALMPAVARERNTILAVAALAYFSRVHSGHRFPFLKFFNWFSQVRKELLVGLIFTAACALPTFSRAAVRSILALWPLAADVSFFALLAWLNCHAIDSWEANEEPPSIPWVFVPACLLAFAGLALCVVFLEAHARCAALIAAGGASALLLALLDRLRSRVTPLALRAAADLVLLTPLALLAR
jgi:hypothetical protein